MVHVDCFLEFQQPMRFNMKNSFLKKMMKKTVVTRSFFILLLLTACSEPGYKRDKKLHSLLQEDLQFIVGEVQNASGKKYLIDSPYYAVEEYHIFKGDTARQIAAIAVVNFYYLDSISIYEQRKYRYQANGRFWDRYYKKMKHSSE